MTKNRSVYRVFRWNMTPAEFSTPQLMIRKKFSYHMSENWYDSKKKTSMRHGITKLPKPRSQVLQLHWIRRKTRPVLKDRARKPAGVFRKSSNKIERGHMRARFVGLGRVTAFWKRDDGIHRERREKGHYHWRWRRRVGLREKRKRMQISSRSYSMLKHRVKFKTGWGR